MTFGGKKQPREALSALTPFVGQDTISPRKSTTFSIRSIMSVVGNSKMRKHRLASSWVLGVLLVVFSFTSAFPKEFESLQIGTTAPGFTLKDLAEKEYRLSDLKGEIVVLQFGGSSRRITEVRSDA